MPTVIVSAVHEPDTRPLNEQMSVRRFNIHGGFDLRTVIEDVTSVYDSKYGLILDPQPDGKLHPILKEGYTPPPTGIVIRSKGEKYFANHLTSQDYLEAKSLAPGGDIDLVEIQRANYHKYLDEMMQLHDQASAETKSHFGRVAAAILGLLVIGGSVAHCTMGSAQEAVHQRTEGMQFPFRRHQIEKRPPAPPTVRMFDI